MSDEPIDSSKVAVDVPLLSDLWNLDGAIRHRFPSEYENGLDATGIYFVRPEALERRQAYCTPTNSIGFAESGGDGEHFSFLVHESAVHAESPIILTAPANSGEENVILAENFECFLRLGLRRGFFGLGQFAYNPDSALGPYGSEEWMPAAPSDYYVGFVPSERRALVLNFIADELQLHPLYYTREVFEALQTRFQPLLQMPASYDDW